MTLFLIKLKETVLIYFLLPGGNCSATFQKRSWVNTGDFYVFLQPPFRTQIMIGKSTHINDYLGGLTLPLDIDLHHVDLGGGMFCWRLGPHFIFSDLTEVVPSLGGLRKKLLVKYHPDKAPDSATFCKIHDFLKKGGPDQATMVHVLRALSSVFKKLMSVDIEGMTINTLRLHCNNFTQSLSYLKNTFEEHIVGITFIDLPGVSYRLQTMVNRFMDKMYEIVSRVGDQHGVFSRYGAIVAEKDLKNKRFVLEEFKVASNKTVPIVIRDLSAMDSVIFTAATSSLFRIISTYVDVFGVSDYAMFRERVLLCFDGEVDKKVVVKPPTPPSKVAQRRPKVKNIPKKTWRDKRPPRINTDLNVVMPTKCNKIRRSKRIAKANPRRSNRFNKR